MVSVPGCLEELLFGLLLSPAFVNYRLFWSGTGERMLMAGWYRWGRQQKGAAWGQHCGVK